MAVTSFSERVVYVGAGQLLGRSAFVSFICDNGGPLETFILGPGQTKMYSGISAGTTCMATVVSELGPNVRMIDNTGQSDDGVVTVVDETRTDECNAVLRSVPAAILTSIATRSCPVGVLIDLSLTASPTIQMGQAVMNLLNAVNRQVTGNAGVLTYDATDNSTIMSPTGPVASGIVEIVGARQGRVKRTVP